jgi:hypothetical protein
LSLLERFSKDTQKSNLIKTISVGAELFHENRTDELTGTDGKT